MSFEAVAQVVLVVCIALLIILAAVMIWLQF